jgi:SanA protein
VKELETVPKLPVRTRRLWRRLRLWSLLLGLAVAAAIWLVQHHVVSFAAGDLYAVGDVPPADCILVPGARIDAEGTPFPMLVDRLSLAVELFQLGKAPCIVVSGRGGGGLAVDEVAAMRRWLLDRGIPAEAVAEDPLGLRTIDSLRRCGDIYGYRSVIVVSNGFHVPRMVFLGRHCGLTVHGVAAPPLFAYSTATLWKNRGREVLARVRACWDVYCWGATASGD